MRYGTMVTNAYQYDSLNRLTNLACTTVSGTIASFLLSIGLNRQPHNLIESVNNFKRQFVEL